MSTSTVTAMAFGVTLEMFDFLLNVRNEYVEPNLAGLLFGDLIFDDNASVTLLNILLPGLMRDNGDIEHSEPMVILLSNTRLAGAEGFVVANVTLPAPVQLPAALPLHAGALALTALVLRRRMRGRGHAAQGGV